ncbi:MAG: hypothetical protein MJ252_21355 [archaeon]|nr:hypothetical protein [archaeon]
MIEIKQQSGRLETVLKSITSKDGNSNLFDHICGMNSIKFEMDDQSKFFDLFEDISLRLKKEGEYKITHGHISTETSEKEKNLLKPLVKVEGEGAEPTPVTSVNYVPDYVEIFQKLSYAGISFGDKESLLLTNSLKSLSSNLTSGSIKFFGKIMGSEKDYYIAEGVDMESSNTEINYDNDMEKIKEEGVNRNIFFVTNDLSEKWVELPVVKPKQIIQSRNIRYTFTGDLNRQVLSNPTFNGQEKHLLRCMIARIYHGAKVVPNCFWPYSVEEAETPFKDLKRGEGGDDEKPKVYTNSQIINLNTWIHYPPGILKCGRVSHFIDEPPEGVDPDEYTKKIKENDPFDKRIKFLNEDKLIKAKYCSGIVPWKIDQYYEDNIYVNPYMKILKPGEEGYDETVDGLKNNKVNNTLTIVKSLRWPGAINVLMGTETTFYYFGDGMKVLEDEEKYCFKAFPKFPEELADKEEHPEPNEPKPVEEKKDEEQK